MLVPIFASRTRPAPCSAGTAFGVGAALSALCCALMVGAALTPVLGQADRLANPAALTEKAPATYKARFDTSKGAIVIEVRRDWAPNGADRFYNLVKNGFYDDTRFFRVISGFMVQFGINGDPSVSAPWRTATIKDDPVKQSNKRGTITFATSGPALAHQPGLHQLRGQRQPRRPGLLAVRSGGRQE